LRGALNRRPAELAPTLPPEGAAVHDAEVGPSAVTCSEGGSDSEAASTSWVVVTHALLPNGAAHRLVQALRSRGRKVALCALPMPGADRWRAETEIDGIDQVTSLTDLPVSVPKSRFVTNPASAVRFARRLVTAGIQRPVLVGCDPLSYLEGLAALRIAGIRPAVKVVWFVDWSAQRLERRLEGAVYRRAVRLAARRADVVCAISAAAAQAINEAAPSRRDRRPVRVLPNLPLAFSDGPPWELRARRVVSMGGLRPEHGTQLLVAVATMLLGDGTASGFDVLGDGPLARTVTRAAEHLPGLQVHGLVQRTDALGHILHRARVGLGIYSPDFPMFDFGDSLKTKDYLAAGIIVVTTIPTAVADGQILVAPFDAQGIADTVRTALSRPPPPRGTHPLLEEGAHALESLLAEVDGLSTSACS